MTDLFAGQVEVHVDDLDHVAAEKCQMLLCHRFHASVLCLSNGPGSQAFQQWLPQLDAERSGRRSAGAFSHRGFDLGNVTVIGAQWGDEGKGKIVDWLASRADMVVRFQGGHNAGHTLVVDGQTYKLSLLPSGIVTGTPSVIGNGVVLDPWALKAEVERIQAQGVKVTPEILMLAETCPLILPDPPRSGRTARGRERRRQDRHDAARHRAGL